MDSIYIVSSIIILVILFLFFNFLFFLSVRNQTKRVFKQIDDYLKRKIELASKIIDEVSRHVSYEKDFLKNIVAAKKEAERAETAEEKRMAGNLLSSVFNAAFKAAEKHPELKVSEKLKRLKQEFGEIEEGVDSLRDLFGQIAASFKKLLKSRPFGVICDLFKKDEKKVKKRIIKKKK